MGQTAPLTLLNCFPARTDGVHSTPGVSVEIIPSQGGLCPRCRIEWWCRKTPSCRHKALPSRLEWGYQEEKYYRPGHTIDGKSYIYCLRVKTMQTIFVKIEIFLEFSPTFTTNPPRMYKKSIVKNIFKTPAVQTSHYSTPLFNTTPV